MTGPADPTGAGTALPPDGPDGAAAAEPLRLYWFWPERARLTTLLGDDAVWYSYRQAAEAVGMVLDVVSVDDVDVVADPARPRVFVRGREVDPDRELFHTKLYTWPQFQPDVWRSLSTFEAIAAAGCYTLIRPTLNLITNDKAATLLRLRGADAGWLPTLSMPTRDLGRLRIRLKDAGIDYPVVVKPASWGSGKGVVVAHSEADLLTALRLASAAELTMVVQPLVGTGFGAGPLGDGGAGLADVRVYCVDGVPVGALRRTPAEDGTVANITAGGNGELIQVPAGLADRAAAVAGLLDTPWLGVDFLCVDDAAYLSEVEIDALIGPVTSRLPGMDLVLARRFEAYRGRFLQWLAAR